MTVFAVLVSGAAAMVSFVGGWMFGYRCAEIDRKRVRT